MECMKLHWKYTHSGVEAVVLFDLEYLCMFIKVLFYIPFSSLNSVTFMKN